MRSLVRNFAGLIAFLLLWELVVRLGVIAEEDVPPASVVLTRIAELFGQEAFLRDVIASVLAWLIALGIAIVIAIPLGLVLGNFPLVRMATRSIVEFLRPIPSVAFDEIDPLLIDTARSCGVHKSGILTTVALPHAAPFVFTGIRISASVGLIVIVSTEFIAGANVGLGSFILKAAHGAGRTDLVLAGTVVAGVIGYLANEGLERLGGKLFKWHKATTAEVA